MKKIALIFTGILALQPDLSYAAVKVNKAASVSTQKTSATESVGSLVPTVINLVGTVQSISKKSRELSAECIPSAAEVSWVNEMIKEWAKTGASTAEEAVNALHMRPCSNGETYASMVEIAADEGDDIVCVDIFAGAGNDDTVWAGFPMASKATYCTDGSFGSSCGASKQKTVSNIYNVFNLIDFTPGVDYTKKESETAAKLIAKIEQCSDAKLNARKRAMWSEFLLNSINTVGQPTNTGAVMQTVTSVTGSGGGLNVQSLGGALGGLTQFLNK
ncbi:hypothetical protein HDR66_01600 [bacterium]|nr:hypothetical protein [bacterium]